MIFIDTSIGAFICTLYCYEKRLFEEMCPLYINNFVWVIIIIILKDCIV